MIFTRMASVPGRWIVAGIALHVLAAALFLSNTLSSNPVRGRPTATARPGPMEERPVAEHAVPLAPAAPPQATPGAAPRQPAPEVRAQAELEALVERATTTLVQALDTPEYENESWLEAVRAQAHTLGAEARPVLEALLANDEHPVEVHIAASELLAALP